VGTALSDRLTAKATPGAERKRMTLLGEVKGERDAIQLAAVSEMFQSALDWLAIGVIAVTPSVRVILKNAAATRALSSNDPLRETSEGLVARTAADTKQLRQTVAERCTTPRAVVFTRADGRAASAVIAGAAGGNAVLFLRGIDEVMEVPPALLSKIYGLTRSEEKLALEIARGQSVEEAAARLSIAPSTARTHLKRIFMKTETNRQGQLVSLLLSNAAAQTRNPSSTA
jgi:DNA-binding CsgD family transcriptional regulator